MKRTLPLLAALVVIVPVGAAQGAEPEVAWTSLWRIGTDHIEFEGNLTVSGEDAAETRQQIDGNYGNSDGRVTATEVANYERLARRTYTENKPECFEDFRFIRIDGEGPWRVSYTEFNIEGAEGAVSSESSMQHETFMGFQYAPGGDRVAVSINVDDSNFYPSLDCYYDRAPTTPPEEDSLVFLLRFHPVSGASIDKDSIRPVEAQDFFDGFGLRYESWGPEMPGQLTFTLDTGASSSSGTVQNVGAWIGYTAAATGGVVGIAFLCTEFGRYQLLRLLFLIPGFTRVEKSEVLEHAKREELYNFIKSNQGPSFSDLRRALELSNGTLVHHLRILESQEFIKARREGFRTRFYVHGPKIVPTSYLTRTQQQLLDVIRANPGLTQKELADVLGLPRQSLFYHTKQLASQGKLEIKQDGNRRRYWLSSTTASSVSGGPRGPT